MACVPVLKDRAGFLDSKIPDCAHLNSSGGGKKEKLCAHRGDQRVRFLSCIPEGSGGTGFSKDENMQQQFSFFPDESIQLENKAGIPPLSSEKELLLSRYIPVYVLLPADVVKRENVFVSRKLYAVNFRALKAAQIDGVRVQVWWGIVESKCSREYDWTAYKLLFSLIQEHGLKLKVSLCFHQHGGSAIHDYIIPLPAWVLKVGERNPDIFFTSKDGSRCQECLSFGIDNETVLCGRSALQVYSDFITSFKENMSSFIDAGVLREVEVGLGPGGELRYPSGRQVNFQCYDKYMLSKLTLLGNSSVHSVSTRYQLPFASEDSWLFLQWYSKALLEHADSLLLLSQRAFTGTVKLGVKLAGLDNHTLTSGYYSLRENGYKSLLKVLSKHKIVLNLACNVESVGRRPETLRSDALARQILTAGSFEGVEVVLENASPVFTRAAFDHILRLSRPDGLINEVYFRRKLSGFTFQRLGQDLMVENNWREFVWFVRRMHAGLDFHPHAEKYGIPVEHRTRYAKPRHSTPLELPSEPPESQQSQGNSFFTTDAPGGGLGKQLEAEDSEQDHIQD